MAPIPARMVDLQFRRDTTISPHAGAGRRSTSGPSTRPTAPTARAHPASVRRAGAGLLLRQGLPGGPAGEPAPASPTVHQHGRLEALRPEVGAYGTPLGGRLAGHPTAVGPPADPLLTVPEQLRLAAGATSAEGRLRALIAVAIPPTWTSTAWPRSTSTPRSRGPGEHLGSIAAEVVRGPDTLNQVVTALCAAEFDILYLVCHGEMIREATSDCTWRIAVPRTSVTGPPPAGRWWSSWRSCQPAPAGGAGLVPDRRCGGRRPRRRGRGPGGHRAQAGRGRHPRRPGHAGAGSAWRPPSRLLRHVLRGAGAGRPGRPGRAAVARGQVRDRPTSGPGGLHADHDGRIWYVPGFPTKRGEGSRLGDALLKSRGNSRGKTGARRSSARACSRGWSARPARSPAAGPTRASSRWRPTVARTCPRSRSSSR